MEVKMFLLIVIISLLEILSQSHLKTVGLELDLNSIGGLDPIEDDSDELYLPDFTEKEIEEYRREKGSDTADNYMKSILDDSETALERKAKSIDLELSLINYFRVQKLDDDSQEVVRKCSKANDLFYKLVELDETVGINQDVRDTIILLVHQAKANVQDIQKVWETYKNPIRAKTLRTFDELEKALVEVGAEYQEKVDNFEYDYGDHEKFYVPEVIARSTSAIKRLKAEEKKIHRMLNVFAKEERNLIKLGVKLWVNSQQDYDINKESLETHESAFMNEKKNQLQRKLITLMNVNRAKVKNETAKATVVKKPERVEL